MVSVKFHKYMTACHYFNTIYVVLQNTKFFDFRQNNFIVTQVNK